MAKTKIRLSNNEITKVTHEFVRLYKLTPSQNPVHLINKAMEVLPEYRRLKYKYYSNVKWIHSIYQQCVDNKFSDELLAWQNQNQPNEIKLEEPKEPELSQQDITAIKTFQIANDLLLGIFNTFGQITQINQSLTELIELYKLQLDLYTTKSPTIRELKPPVQEYIQPKKLKISIIGLKGQQKYEVKKIFPEIEIEAIEVNSKHRVPGGQYIFVMQKFINHAWSINAKKIYGNKTIMVHGGLSDLIGKINKILNLQ